MCHFITLIAPTDDALAIDSFMREHGRRGMAIDNPSVAQRLEGNERQYLTTAGHCDCGTVLTPRGSRGRGDLDEELTRERVKLERRGWSAGKIARALDDRRKTAERPDGGGCDSLEQWAEILTAMKARFGFQRIGLFVRMYSGSIRTEQFPATRREVRDRTPLVAQLGSMAADEVTIFG